MTHPAKQPDEQPTEQSQQINESGGGTSQRMGRSWSYWVDDQIRQAQARGEFDNLPGTGKPLAMDVNPQAGDKALAYSILKQNNTAPPEIELGKEIDALLRRADKLRAELRSKRDAFLSLRKTTNAQIAAFNAIQAQYIARYETLLREARSKALTLIITAPAALHRPLIDVKERASAFQAEFPPLELQG